MSTLSSWWRWIVALFALKTCCCRQLNITASPCAVWSLALPWYSANIRHVAASTGDYVGDWKYTELPQRETKPPLRCQMTAKQQVSPSSTINQLPSVNRIFPSVLIFVLLLQRQIALWNTMADFEDMSNDARRYHQSRPDGGGSGAVVESQSVGKRSVVLGARNAEGLGREAQTHARLFPPLSSATPLMDTRLQRGNLFSLSLSPLCPGQDHIHYEYAADSCETRPSPFNYRESFSLILKHYSPRRVEQIETHESDTVICHRWLASNNKSCPTLTEACSCYVSMTLLLKSKLHLLYSMLFVPF